MSGKNYKLFVSSDGTDTGVKTEVELQGDMTINLGKSASRTAYKNGAKSSAIDNGFSATCSIGDEAPMPAGHVLLWDAQDNDGKIYAWIESSESGGKTWEGEFIAVIQDLNAPTEGEAGSTIEISENGPITRGTVA